VLLVPIPILIQPFHFPWHQFYFAVPLPEARLRWRHTGPIALTRYHAGTFPALLVLLLRSTAGF